MRSKNAQAKICVVILLAMFLLALIVIISTNSGTAKPLMAKRKKKQYQEKETVVEEEASTVYSPLNAQTKDVAGVEQAEAGQEAGRDTVEEETTKKVEKEAKDKAVEEKVRKEAEDKDAAQIEQEQQQQQQINPTSQRIDSLPQLGAVIPTCFGRPAGTLPMHGTEVYCDGDGKALLQYYTRGCADYGERSQTAVTPNACGYLSESVVKELAKYGTAVRLEDGEGQNTAVESTNAMQALVDGTNWHVTPPTWDNNPDSWDFSPNKDICGERPRVDQWPHMNHACGNVHGVHWIHYERVPSRTAAAAVSTKTWLRMANEQTVFATQTSEPPYAGAVWELSSEWEWTADFYAKRFTVSAMLAHQDKYWPHSKRNKAKFLAEDEDAAHFVPPPPREDGGIDDERKEEDEASLLSALYYQRIRNTQQCTPLGPNFAKTVADWIVRHYYYHGDVNDSNITNNKKPEESKNRKNKKPKLSPFTYYVDPTDGTTIKNKFDPGETSQQRQRRLVYFCPGGCGGTGDRYKGMIMGLYMAILLNRKFELMHTRPGPLQRVIEPNLINWIPTVLSPSKYTPNTTTNPNDTPLRQEEKEEKKESGGNRNAIETAEGEGEGRPTKQKTISKIQLDAILNESQVLLTAPHGWYKAREISVSHPGSLSADRAVHAFFGAGDSVFEKASHTAVEYLIHPELTPDLHASSLTQRPEVVETLYFRGPLTGLDDFDTIGDKEVDKASRKRGYRNDFVNKSHMAWEKRKKETQQQQQQSNQNMKKETKWNRFKDYSYKNTDGLAAPPQRFPFLGLSADCNYACWYSCMYNMLFRPTDQMKKEILDVLFGERFNFAERPVEEFFESYRKQHAESPEAKATVVASATSAEKKEVEFDFDFAYDRFIPAYLAAHPFVAAGVRVGGSKTKGFKRLEDTRLQPSNFPMVYNALEKALQETYDTYYHPRWRRAEGQVENSNNNNKPHVSPPPVIIDLFITSDAEEIVETVLRVFNNSKTNRPVPPLILRGENGAKGKGEAQTEATTDYDSPQFYRGNQFNDSFVVRVTRVRGDAFGHTDQHGDDLPNFYNTLVNHYMIGLSAHTVQGYSGYGQTAWYAARQRQTYLLERGHTLWWEKAEIRDVPNFDPTEVQTRKLDYMTWYLNNESKRKYGPICSDRFAICPRELFFVDDAQADYLYEEDTADGLGKGKQVGAGPGGVHRRVLQMRHLKNVAGKQYLVPAFCPRRYREHYLEDDLALDEADRRAAEAEERGAIKIAEGRLLIDPIGRLIESRALHRVEHIAQATDYCMRSDDFFDEREARHQHYLHPRQLMSDSPSRPQEIVLCGNKHYDC